jgi:hypothetical protein
LFIIARTLPDRVIRNYHDSVSRPRRSDADDGVMNPNDTAIAQLQVDERFVDDWIRFGISELEAYLGKHARFDAYCSRRDASPAGL